MNDQKTTIARTKLDALLTEYRLAKRAVVAEKATLRAGRNEATALAEAQAVVQEVAQAIQTTAHARIAEIVTRCLAAVFGDEAYVFRIHFAKERGKTSARLELERDGLVLTDPLAEAGGGVLDVAAFALRLSCLLLAQPRRRRLLVLDEPWRCLSAQYRPALRAIVETLTRECGCQLVLVTHADDFRIGKVIELGDEA